MIYGANGYTGGLAARVAKDRNFSPVLAGRHAEHIRRLARELGFESRVFDLADATVAATKLEGVAAVCTARDRSPPPAGRCSPRACAPGRTISTSPEKSLC
jgi:short subunit dehydrogenase-like uncharacterized protein